MSAPARASMWGALRRRNYRLFVAGQLVSLAGTWTQSVAQTWLVYRLTGSALWLGVATFCQQAPVFFLATVGGLLADRHPRRTVLLVTQASAMVLAFALAALTLGGVVRVAHLLVLATALGAINAVDGPTRQSFVIEMVGRENLASAVALNSSMAVGATVVGPAIAGVAIRAIGEGWCFFANGVSFIAVIVGLAAMRDLPTPLARPSRESMRSRLLEGFRFVSTHERLRGLLVLLALTALMGIPYATLMPVFASKVLHGDARTLGWLMGASGAGALLAGLTLASRRSLEGAYRWVGPARSARRAARALLDVAHVLAVDRARGAARRGDVDAGQRDEHAHPGADARRLARPRHGDLGDDLHGLRARRVHPRGRARDGIRSAPPVDRGRRRPALSGAVGFFRWGSTSVRRRGGTRRSMTRRGAGGACRSWMRSEPARSAP